MMGHGKIIFFNEILYMLLNNWGKKSKFSISHFTPHKVETSSTNQKNTQKKKQKWDMLGSSLGSRLVNPHQYPS